MITRFDTAPINKVTVDPQTGFLHASNVPVARVGVFQYLHADGTWTSEAKLPEEILSDPTVESANNKPVTNDHPVDDGENVLVDKSNSSQYAKGFTADNAHIEGDTLKVGLTVMDPQLIDAIQNDGKQELSIGFQTDVVPTSGEYKGAKYDSVQRNIQINHVAVVDRAREGHNIRITGDSAQMAVNDKPRKEKEMAKDSKKKTLDNAENGKSSSTSSSTSSTSSTPSSSSSSSSSSDDKDKQIADLKQQVKDLQAQLASKNSNSNDEDNSDGSKDTSKPAPKSKSKSDSVDAEIEELKAERDKYKAKVEGDSFNNAFDERIELIDDAKKILGDSYDFKGKSNKQIKIDSIKKADNTIDVDDKPDAYYDGILEVIKNRKTGVVGYPRQSTIGDSVDESVAKTKQARANLYYASIKK